MRRRIWAIIRWVLFRIDPETAHRFTIAMIRLGYRLGGIPLRVMAGGGTAAGPSSGRTVWGMEFRSRVGLAAGFDKDGEILEALPSLGFGFAEVGTVTPRPQPGNDRPRLFRDPATASIFNRMGFNGLGATLVAQRVATARAKLPESFRIGVNLGKNKDTPLEEAALDYVRAAVPFEGLCDYLVINVSSPNTPGLRSLQSVEALQPIVAAVNGRITGWKRRPPLLLKIAPELKGQELVQLLLQAESWGVDGWILTNTLAGSWPRAAGEPLTGGWSGGRLTQDSWKSLLEARRATRLPIISVGGVMSVEEAVARRSAGADLVQLYSGWIYGGPSFPAEVAKRFQS